VGIRASAELKRDVRDRGGIGLSTAGGDTGYVEDEDCHLINLRIEVLDRVIHVIGPGPDDEIIGLARARGGASANRLKAHDRTCQFGVPMGDGARDGSGGGTRDIEEAQGGSSTKQAISAEAAASAQSEKDPAKQATCVTGASGALQFYCYRAVSGDDGCQGVC